jgi:excinuclease ABC subunit B
LKAPYEPTGDQPAAIAHLVECLQKRKDRFALLKGATGTGKTFAMANLISKLNRPTLVLCHNKTLAAQLCRELRSFFPDSAVELFVSYYNHYRPESYKESTQTYMSKKSSINQDIDILRHCATRSLVSRNDVVVVASVSCIYGIGLPEDYLDAAVQLSVGDTVPWDWIGQSLELSLLYGHCDPEDDSRFERGKYQMVTTTNTTTKSESHGVDSDDASVLSRTVTLWPPHEPFPVQVQFHAIQGDGPSRLRVAAIRKGTVKGFRDMETTKIFPVRSCVAGARCLHSLTLILIYCRPNIMSCQRGGCSKHVMRSNPSCEIDSSSCESKGKGMPRTDSNSA